MADNAVTVVRIILAVILPPLGVFLKHGIKVRAYQHSIQACRCMYDLVP